MNAFFDETLNLFQEFRGEQHDGGGSITDLPNSKSDNQLMKTNKKE
jgi:hypothetical protein